MTLRESVSDKKKTTSTLENPSQPRLRDTGRSPGAVGMSAADVGASDQRREMDGSRQERESQAAGASHEVGQMAGDFATTTTTKQGGSGERRELPASWGTVRRVLHANIFLYAFCFWMQTGVLPYLTRRLGMDMVVYGYLQTFYNFVQLVGTPLFGRFGDLYGGRAALTLAFANAAAMYGLLGVATTGAFVFLSRVPALFLNANNGTQMVIADMTEESQRAQAMGRQRLSYGLGMILGPLVGGLVTRYYSEQHAALVACLGSVLSVILVQVFIPSLTKRVTASKIEEERSMSGIFNFEKYINLVTQTPGALFFLTVTMVAALPNAILQSMFSAILMDKFELTAEYNGYVLSSLAVVGILIQGFCIGPLTKRFSDMVLLRASAVILIVAFALMMFTQTIVHLGLVMLPLTCGNSVIGIILSTVLTKIVSATDTGTMLGLGSAGGLLVSLFAPTVGGLLLSRWGFFSFGAVGVAVNTLLLLILCRYQLGEH